ncbi:radical SAM protein [Candidatus Woesearchaeota archaeon]|nr:radical SAM protein [Candidatus Woesearchaeota archaeon]
MINKKKMRKFVKAYLKAQFPELFNPFPAWVHLWVTDRCNESCSYCYVKNNTSKNPDTGTVKEWIEHADDLGATVIAFMGGEPTLRDDLAELVSHINSKNIITYLTSNGKLLSYERTAEIARAGLDVLEISIDGYDNVEGSNKTLNHDETVLDILKQVHDEYGLRYKLHQVLTPQTIKETPKLLELAARRNLSISFGLAPETFDTVNTTHELDDLNTAISLIIQKKRTGVPVVNPYSYFSDAINYFSGRVNWNCDIGRYFIQVATNGMVYKCSKLRDVTNVRFLDADLDYFKNDFLDRKELLQQCMPSCYSACAYTTSHIRQHPLYFFSTLIKLG